MSLTPQTRGELLASISSMSKQVLACLDSGSDISHVTVDHNLNVPPESVHVPKPPPLLPRLVEAGAPQHLAQEMHTIYLDHAKRLRTHYLAVISRLRKDLPQLPTDSVDTFHDQLVPLLLHMYTKALQGWMREGVGMFRTRRPPAHKKPFNQLFNHDYVPLLEQFFDQNPFPTHADKAFLARKSSMSYQQIHVWFQNRRSRSRKIGKVLCRKPTPEVTTSPVCADSCVTKPDETIVYESCRDESKKFDPRGQPFTCCSAGRLSCPTQAEVKFDPSWWPHRPSSAKPRRFSFDMDALVEQFSQMSVRDRTSGRGKKCQDGLRYPLAATSSFTVLPPLAPHPALIRRRDVSLPPLPPLVVPHTSASRSTRLRAFNAPNPSPSPNLLVSSVVPHFPESPYEKWEVVPNDSSGCGTRLTFKCGPACLRTSQRTSQYIPCLSTNTIPNCVPPRNGSPRVRELGDHSLATIRALSRRAVLPWDFRFAVTV
ncbi:hypothetical protein EDD16DRAFT_1574501 [Pisolithus croceorrhizus]|nr:hypothetical protein EDD16DRAFT_1574501 [Pisolithus croceorrhizus]